MAVFDTSFLIDLLRGHGPAVRVLDLIEESEEPQIAPAPAVYEVAVELGRQRTPSSRARRVHAALDGLIVHPLDERIALEGGRIAGRLVDKGTPIDDIDCMIAATALALEERVVTRNERHFRHVRGLKVEAY